MMGKITRDKAKWAGIELSLFLVSLSVWDPVDIRWRGVYVSDTPRVTSTHMDAFYGGYTSIE